MTHERNLGTQKRTSPVWRAMVGKTATAPYCAPRPQKHDALQIGLSDLFQSFCIKESGNGMSFLSKVKKPDFKSTYWVQSVPAEKWCYKMCEPLKNQPHREQKGQVIWSQSESKADRLLCLFLGSTKERQSSRAFSPSQHSCSESQHSKYLHSMEPRAESTVRVTTHLLQCANIL